MYHLVYLAGTGTEGVEDQGRKRETKRKGTDLGRETPAGGRVLEARGRRVRHGY